MYYHNLYSSWCGIDMCYYLALIPSQNAQKQVGIDSTPEVIQHTIRLISAHLKNSRRRHSRSTHSSVSCSIAHRPLSSCESQLPACSSVYDQVDSVQRLSGHVAASNIPTPQLIDVPSHSVKQSLHVHDRHLFHRPFDHPITTSLHHAVQTELVTSNTSLVLNTSACLCISVTTSTAMEFAVHGQPR